MVSFCSSLEPVNVHSVPELRRLLEHEVKNYANFANVSLDCGERGRCMGVYYSANYAALLQPPWGDGRVKSDCRAT